MDYSPWSEREIWSFLKVAISPKPEKPHPPKLVCMHLTSTSTCMNFFSRFYLIQFFDDHGLHVYGILYIVYSITIYYIVLVLVLCLCMFLHVGTKFWQVTNCNGEILNFWAHDIEYRMCICSESKWFNSLKVIIAYV